MFEPPATGIIAGIKIPKNYKFDFSTVGDMKLIPKDETFCRVNVFKINEDRFAVKIIQKDKIPSQRFEEEYRRVANQIRILYQLNHPYIVKLLYHEETEKEIKLLMEYGGVRLKGCFKSTYLNEEQVRKTTKQILEALKYVHDEGFIHRDLEPENILVNKQEQTVKLIDFGFIDEVGFRRTKIGSYHYMAPEITGDNTYNQKVDIWSLGVIVYEMLHQDLPFCSRKSFTQESFEENKHRLKISFDSQLSQKAINFIKRMLVLDPEERASASQLLRHEFIEPEEDLSIFDREGTEKKTHKYQYIREKSQEKHVQDIEELQGQLKRTMCEVFACMHNQKDTLSNIFQTYRQILTKTIEEKQKRVNQ